MRLDRVTRMGLEVCVRRRNLLTLLAMLDGYPTRAVSSIATSGGEGASSSGSVVRRHLDLSVPGRRERAPRILGIAHGSGSTSATRGQGPL